MCNVSSSCLHSRSIVSERARGACVDCRAVAIVLTCANCVRGYDVCVCVCARESHEKVVVGRAGAVGEWMFFCRGDLWINRFILSVIFFF